MEKIIKVIALTNNQYLISEIEEVGSADIGEPDCRLVNPFSINTESGRTILEPFLIDITKEKIFMIGSDKILTLADPTPTLLEQYLDLLK